MYKNNFIGNISKIAVDIMFYGGIICCIAVPWFTKFIRDFYGYGSREYYIMNVILFISGGLAVYIMFNLKQMFKTLIGGNPFVIKNVNNLKHIAVACALISIIFIIKCFLIFSFATVAIILVFTIGTLFCLTLKDIFKQAIYYKEDSDLTV